MNRSELYLDEVVNYFSEVIYWNFLEVESFNYFKKIGKKYFDLYLDLVNFLI